MKDKNVSYAIIVAAKKGVPEAIEAILKHNAARIDRFSRRIRFDEYGNPSCIVDPEIRDRIVTKLIDGIIYDFDPYRLPDGETLEE